MQASGRGRGGRGRSGGRGRGVPGGRGGNHNKQWNNPHWDSNAPSAAFNAALRPAANGHAPGARSCKARRQAVLALRA